MEANDKYRRRKSDEQFIDHEKRLIVVEVVVQRLDDHHRDDLEVLKNIHERLRGLDERILVVTKEQNGTFTKEQVLWLSTFFDERNELREGRRAVRFLMWQIGIFAAGATTAVLTFLGLKR